MTGPDDFLRQHPDWYREVSSAMEPIIWKMAGGMDRPWTANKIRVVEAHAMQITIDVFSPYRDQIGDEVFGLLVMRVGELVRERMIV